LTIFSNQATIAEVTSMSLPETKMLQPAISYVLIAVVLICPYACLGDEAGWESSFCSIDGCCCSHEPAPPGGETPTSPEDEDSNCLCHGAIFDSQLRTTDLDQANPQWFYRLGNGATLSAVGSSLVSISFEPPHQFPPFSTGWDVCRLTCTLVL
jgi:hypothetical protein